MLKKTILTAIFLATSLSFQTAQADSDRSFYYGIQYSMIDYTDDAGFEFSPSAVVLKAGLPITDVLSIEGRIGTGAREDESGLISLEINSVSGLYLVATHDGGNERYLYAFLGGSEGEVEAEALGVSAKDDDSDFSYGVGLNIGSFNIEFADYMDKSDFKVNALSIGYYKQF